MMEQNIGMDEELDRIIIRKERWEDEVEDDIFK